MTSDCSQTLGLIIDLCFHYLFLKNPNISSFELKYLANIKRHRQNQAYFKIIQKNFIRWLHLFHLVWGEKYFTLMYIYLFILYLKIDYKQVKYRIKKDHTKLFFLKFIKENVLSSAESNFTCWDVFFHK